jgi:hypothetical protein
VYSFQNYGLMWDPLRLMYVLMFYALCKTYRNNLQKMRQKRVRLFISV